MADRYINSAYITDHWGSGLVTAITSITGIDLDVKIEASTAIIKSAAKNSGYDLPDTQTPADVDELWKVAVLGHLLNMLAMIPEVSLPIPESWNDEKVMGPGALAALIIAGDLPSPDSDPDLSGGVGGFQITENDPTASTTRAQNTSRTELDYF